MSNVEIWSLKFLSNAISNQDFFYKGINKVQYTSVVRVMWCIV